MTNCHVWHENLCFFYQPIVDLRSMSIHMHEQLLRDLDEDGHGFFPESSFDRIVRSGLSFDLFLLGIKEAAKKAKRGHMVSVNLEPGDISDENLRRLDLLCSKCEIPHGNITIELTERRGSANPKQIFRFVEEARKMGFVVALDDFGTSCANFDMLLNGGFDYIKLDGNFLATIALSQSYASFFGKVIDAVHSLGIPMIAEKIEDAYMFDWISGYGIQYGQGNFFGKPVRRIKSGYCDN